MHERLPFSLNLIETDISLIFDLIDFPYNSIKVIKCSLALNISKKNRITYLYMNESIIEI